LAYVYDQGQDENNTEQGPNNQGGTGAPGSGQAGVSGGGATSTPQQSRPTSSGSFTNIQNYIKANQNSDLGSKLGGQLQGVSDKAKQDIAASGQNFNQAAEQGRQQFNSGMVNSAVNDPTNFAAQDPNVAAFQKQLNAQYSGPKDLQNFSQLQGQVGQAKGLANLGGTESGRQSLLQNFFSNNGQYNRGQQTLDNLILQGSPQQNLGLQQARTQAGQAGQALGQTRQAAQGLAGQYGQEAQNTASQTNAALQGGQTGVVNPIQERLKQEQSIENDRQQTEQHIRDLLNGQAFGQPTTGGLTPGGVNAQGFGNDNFAATNDPNQQIQNTLQYASGRGLFNPADTEQILADQRQLLTPIEQLTIRHQAGADQGILGYGGASKGQTFTVNSTPMLSQLKLNDLLRESIQSGGAQNLTAGGVMTPEENAKLQAYAKLAGNGAISPIQAGDAYKGGTLGFDLKSMQDKINKDQAFLRKESLIDLGTTPGKAPSTFEMIQRGLLPTTAQAGQDINADISKIGQGGGKNIVGGTASLLADPFRAGAGAVGQEVAGLGKGMIGGTGQILNGDVSGGAGTLATSPLDTTANLVNGVGSSVASAPLIGNSQLGKSIGQASATPINSLGQALSAPGQTVNDFKTGNFSNLAQQLAAPVTTAASGFHVVNDALGGTPQIVKDIINPVGAIGGALGTFICTELLSKGLINYSEYKAIHSLQFKSFFRRGRFAAWYIDHGQTLVDKANEQGIDWSSIKKWFFDDVLNQPTQLEAEDAYGRASEKLCRMVAPNLWQDRLWRNSYLDSLIFLPKILTFKQNRQLVVSKIRRMFV